MNLRVLLAIPFALLALAGCSGGGGGGDDGGIGGDNGRVSVFATDDLNTNYDHVWVNVQRVTLLSPSGQNETTIFENAEGLPVDLRSLADPNGNPDLGRFLFLGDVAVPRGVYRGIRVTLDKDLTIFPAGAAQGTAATFADSAGETKTFELLFAPPRQLGQNDDLVLDFDLRNWTLENGVVSASAGQFLRLGNGNGLNDRNRFRGEDYKGNIASLSGTAPDQSFVLRRGIFSVRVQLDADTAIFNENGAQTPLLQNGQRVEVRGVYDNTRDLLLATSVKIEDNNNDNDRDEDEAKGPVTDVNAAAGTFTLDIRETKGFLPNSETVRVVTTGTTRLFSDRGVRLTAEEFYARLASVTEVEVEGQYDPATNTLTAFKAKLEDEDDDREDRAEIEGPVSDVNAGAGTFRVTAREWEGVNVRFGESILVQTTANTRFRTRNDEVNQAQFFAALANGRRVEVEGAFDTNTDTLRAVKVKFEDDNDDGDDNGGDDDDNSGPG